jgi:hypothetical protein
MSTNSIHIDNYEAFYLDYLEGNLNEADTALLLDFLKAHPELQLEDEALEYLEEELISPLDASTKSFLKFPDLQQAVSAETIELFLVALVENQLSDEKIAELRRFLLQYPSFERELHYYQLAKLKPELNVVFPAKRSLKKGGAIVPMYYPAIAAAASVLLIFGWMNYSGNQTDPALTAARVNKHDTVKHLQQDQRQFNLPVSDTDTDVAAAQNFIAWQKGTTGTTIQPANPQLNTAALPSDRHHPRETTIVLPLKSVSQLHNEMAATQPEKAHYRVPMVAEKEVQQADVALAFDEMKNPIKPITKRLERTFNRDVDFRTAKAAPKKQGGFYLKIGKFEISRKYYYDNGAVAMK